MEAVNVVIADSSELIRIGLKAIFVQSEIISIVGEANSNNELKELATSRKPDIIIVDYTSKDFDIRVIPEVLQRLPSVRFVAITKDQSAQTIVDALRSGVTSYVKKDCSAHEITESVIENNAGTINVTSGKLSFTATIDSFTGTYIEITADPDSNDLAPKRNELLTILVDECTLSGEVDTMITGGTSAGVNYSTTARHD